jgi:alkaline phosphatase D
VRDRAAVEDGSFYGGEPLWVTAEKQGVKSASFYWVGSEAPVQGTRPSFWKRYDEKVAFSSRTDSVIAWLSLPEEKRPHLVMLYYHEPDAIGHHDGPESDGVIKVVKVLENELRYLVRRLQSLPIAGQIHLIVTTDHGMQSTGKERSVLLTDFIDPDWFTMVEGSSPVYLFGVKENMADTALAALQRIPHTRAWLTKNIPPKLHYGTNPRTLDMVLLADSGWTIRKNNLYPVSAGAHGYDPDNTNMQGIFYATGPAFKKGYRSPVFENVDLYPLVCRILSLKPAPVDGRLERVEGMLLISGEKP